MPAVILVVVALIGAAVQVYRQPAPRNSAQVAETFLLWWLVAAVGIASIIAAAFHVFDGADIAENIGFTRGDGGFQFENAMGDLALGVVAVMCVWFRGNFWVAALTFLAIQYLGDAYGHIYQWIENDNTEPYNIGIPLWLDIILPIVGWGLFAVSKRAPSERPSEVATAT